MSTLNDLFTHTTSTTHHDLTIRQPAAWPKSAVRILFGVVWAIDATFKWQPAFHAEYLSLLQGAAKGQPAWLLPWFHGIANAVAANPVLFSYITAVVETMIAAGLLFGVMRKLTYILGGLFAAAIWSSAEGFGGPYTTGATDIGTSIIYVIVFVALLALNYHAGPSRFSVDYYIEKRFPAWRKIAELGRRKESGALQEREPEYQETR